MKKTIISVVIVAVAIVGLVFLLKMKPSGTLAPVVENPNQTESKYLVTREPQMVSIAEDSYLAGISGTYPQFPQADAVFNAKIKQVVTDGVADFKKTANDNYAAQLEIEGDEFQKRFAETGGYTYNIETKLVQSNDDFISVLVRFEGYSGGAHPYHGAVSFNYDVKNKKELSITDFATIEYVSKWSYRLLVDRFTEQEVIDDSLIGMIRVGTDVKQPENFQTFTFISPTEITVYFGEYQVAPYVYGEQQVTFDTTISTM